MNKAETWVHSELHISRGHTQHQQTCGNEHLKQKMGTCFESKDGSGEGVEEDGAGNGERLLEQVGRHEQDDDVAAFRVLSFNFYRLSSELHIQASSIKRQFKFKNLELLLAQKVAAVIGFE